MPAETLPAFLIALSSPEEVTPEILVLVKRHCDKRLARSQRPIHPARSMIGAINLVSALCDDIPGELEKLALVEEAVLRREGRWSNPRWKSS